MNIIPKDKARLIFEAVKNSSSGDNIRKQFYLSPCGNYISFKKVGGYSYHKTSELVAQLKLKVQL